MHTTLGRALLCALAAFAAGGCQWVPKSQLAACQSQSQKLSEQSRAQLAEIENLKVHKRKIEDQLIQAEQDLALMDQKLGADRKQLANFQRERDRLQQQFTGVGPDGEGMAIGINGRLAELSQRYPSLQYDPQTGVSKLDVDILFDSAEAELKPDAQRMLTEFANILQAPEAREMKVMVVGHTDELKIARKEARERFPDNWRLSTARAVAVAKHLQKSGMTEDRLGVAGFAGTQPVSPNLTAAERRKNRRVEIFVVGPETPIVGWTESMTGLY